MMQSTEHRQERNIEMDREKRIELNASQLSKTLANDCLKGNPDEVFEKIKQRIKEAYIKGADFADENPKWPLRKFTTISVSKQFDTAFMPYNPNQREAVIDRELAYDFGRELFKQNLVKTKLEQIHYGHILLVRASVDVALRDARRENDEIYP